MLGFIFSSSHAALGVSGRGSWGRDDSPTRAARAKCRGDRDLSWTKKQARATVSRWRRIRSGILLSC